MSNRSTIFKIWHFGGDGFAISISANFFAVAGLVAWCDLSKFGLLRAARPKLDQCGHYISKIGYHCCIFHRQFFLPVYQKCMKGLFSFACAVRHGFLSAPRVNSWPPRVKMPLALQAVPSGSSAVWLEALSKVQVVLLAFLASHLEALKKHSSW